MGVWSEAQAPACLPSEALLRVRPAVGCLQVPVQSKLGWGGAGLMETLTHRTPDEECRRRNEEAGHTLCDRRVGPFRCECSDRETCAELVREMEGASA